MLIFHVQSPVFSVVVNPPVFLELWGLVQTSLYFLDLLLELVRRGTEVPLWMLFLLARSGGIRL